MPKKKKSSNLYGAQGMQSTNVAGRISRQPGATSTGVNQRVLNAQSKVQQLVGQGYRLGKGATTSKTYKAAVKSAGSSAGRLKKLFR